jgi:uncharacterized protein GlcG (DUF336 family)
MRAISGCLAVIGLSSALAAPAGAQLLTEKGLSAGMAMTIAQTALETCTKQGYHVSVHVLGRNGEVIGAVGVSGAPGGEKDEACSKSGIDKVADQLK